MELEFQPRAVGEKSVKASWTGSEAGAGMGLEDLTGLESGVSTQMTWVGAKAQRKKHT